MAGDCNIYGGLISGGISSEVTWGDIKGNIANQSDLTLELENKVDKISGKGLSTNDFTNDLKDKLESIDKIYLITIEKSWNKLSNDVYTQVIPVNGIKENDIAIVNIELSEDKLVADKELESWSKITKIIINNGNITVYCSNGIPSTEMKIKIKI